MANMQWSLFVLILMGQCSFCLCLLHEYHFVRERKTWEEAQTYCREHCSDLAKVFDMTDMKRLTDSASNQGEAWIGLQNQNNVNRKWLWSLPGVKFNDSETEWKDGEPNDNPHPENCVMMINHKWIDVSCTKTYPFICYDGKKQKQFHLINTTKTWLKAQSYCREHHTDLVSGLTQLNDEEFKTIEQSRYVWIGLFRDTWRWSDESNSSFRFWDPDQFTHESNKKCAMTVSNGKWSSDECKKRKPFFCYDNRPLQYTTTTTPTPTTTTPTPSTAAPTTTQEALEPGCDATMTDEVILIKENKTWEQALTYCRENHRDLISITNPQKQRCAGEVAKQANSPYVWTGLRYTCTLGFWFWITDERVSYKNWELQDEMDECDMSGAMATGGDHKWSKKNADEKFNFICTKR